MSDFYGEKVIKLLRGDSFFFLGKRILKCRSAPGCSVPVTIRKSLSVTKAVLYRHTAGTDHLVYSFHLLL